MNRHEFTGFARLVTTSLLVSVSPLTALRSHAAGPCKEAFLSTRAGTATQLESCLTRVPGIRNGRQNRDFVLNAEGQLLVFNGFGSSGRNSRDTGFRTFFLLPVKQRPSIEKNPISGRLVVRTPSGVTLLLRDDGSIERAEGGAQIREDRTISASNGGGIEFDSFDGILLDCGWAVGKQTIEKRSGSCSFNDRDGNSCSVPNSKLFTYSDGEASFTLARDNKKLSAFLKKECPRLSQKPFEHAQPGAPAPGGARTDVNQAR